MIKSLVDWEPYRPFTVGFDSLWDRLQTLELDVPNYPPYNIRKIDDLKYSIDLALAGFGKDDIEVEISDGTLSIRSDKKDDDSDNLYRGISYRRFDRKFTLSEDIVVKGAKLENGMLTVDLERIVPEEKKPRLIEVK